MRWPVRGSLPTRSALRVCVNLPNPRLVTCSPRARAFPISMITMSTLFCAAMRFPQPAYACRSVASERAARIAKDRCVRRLMVLLHGPHKPCLQRTRARVELTSKPKPEQTGSPDVSLIANSPQSQLRPAGGRGRRRSGEAPATESRHLCTTATEPTGMPATNITEEHRNAFEALTSGHYDNFAFFSCLFQRRIAEAATAREAAAIGRAPGLGIAPDWNAQRVDVMRWVLRMKRGANATEIDACWPRPATGPSSRSRAGIGGARGAQHRRRYRGGGMTGGVLRYAPDLIRGVSKGAPCPLTDPSP